MRRWSVLLVPVLVSACADGAPTPVGVTLDDGQVLVGEITTETLSLDGAFGEIPIPLADIGMVLPIEGRTLEDANGHVTVWLRNGSELRGEWAVPELAIGLAVGGRVVDVDVPPERLQALQLQGAEEWPDDGLFRVRTSWGDDFLVDPTRTRISLTNELGTFEPLLDECAFVGPEGAADGPWRVVLATGTVLVGELQQAEITFALPMGPDEITVPLEALVSLDRTSWGAPSSTPVAPAVFDLLPEAPAPAPADAGGRDAARPGLSSSAGWFENDRYESAKHR